MGAHYPPNAVPRIGEGETWKGNHGQWLLSPSGGPVKHGAVVPPSRPAIRPVVHEMALRAPSPQGGVQVLSG